MPDPFQLPTEKGAVIPINESPVAGERDFDYLPGYLGQEVVDQTTGDMYVAVGVTSTDWLAEAAPVAPEVQSITGALSDVTDAAAQDVLTSIIAALVALGLATDDTT